MIRVIGINKSVYQSILNHNSNIVRRDYFEVFTIEFIPECTLELSNGGIEISCGDNIVHFLMCDFWRIEIE